MFTSPQISDFLVFCGFSQLLYKNRKERVKAHKYSKKRKASFCLSLTVFCSSVPDQMKAFQILHNQSKHAVQKQPFTMISVTEDLSSVTFCPPAIFSQATTNPTSFFLSHTIQWANVAFCLKDGLIPWYENASFGKESYLTVNILT